MSGLWSRALQGWFACCDCSPLWFIRGNPPGRIGAGTRGSMVLQSLTRKPPGFRARSFIFASAALSVVASACTGAIGPGMASGGNEVGGNGAGRWRWWRQLECSSGAGQLRGRERLHQQQPGPDDVAPAQHLAVRGLDRRSLRRSLGPRRGGVQRPAGDGLQHRRELAGGAGAQRQSAHDQCRVDRRLGGDQPPGRRHRMQQQRPRLSRIVHSLVRQARLPRAAQRQQRRRLPGAVLRRGLVQRRRERGDRGDAAVAALPLSHGARRSGRARAGRGRDHRAHSLRSRVQPVVPDDRQRA